MDDIAFQIAQKRIDFLNRWSLALFTVATLLISWLAARYEAEQFGMVFNLGMGCLVLVAPLCCGLVVAAHLRLKRLEKLRNV